MDVGFIGLGHMGFPMAARLAGAGHRLFVYDTCDDIVNHAVAAGAQAASSPRDVANRVDCVLASLPSVQASVEVATGSQGVIAGSRPEFEAIRDIFETLTSPIPPVCCSLVVRTGAGGGGLSPSQTVGETLPCP